MQTSTATRETAPLGIVRTTLFSALTGLAALAILLQGLWAGIFLEHDGQRDDAGGWIDVHARGGEVALVLGSGANTVIDLGRAGAVIVVR